ncbi:MAG: SprT-like domain-containing protein [Bacteroidales bacterium]|nr:SprT-like domain-containing protein [Bacteroidales bacterium]
MPSDKEILSKYIPERAVPVILTWLKQSNVQLKISRTRNSKHGDYRPPVQKPYHRISVNHSLNKYHFLLTLVHEYAHLKVWENHKNKVRPHGAEWKEQFRALLTPILVDSVFPEDLLPVLKKYIKNPGATSGDAALVKAFRKYDDKPTHLTLDDIPSNALFRIQNGMVFEKGEKRRTRYKCRRIDNNRMYLVSAVAEVIPVNVQKEKS